jgi:hypothetical protein
MIKLCLRELSGPRLLYGAVLWLMILLIAGTVAQRWDGIYLAERTYFSSLILWVGPIPTPGGSLTIGLIALNLAMKLLFATKWSLRNSGTVLTHAAVLLLLSGGLLTAVRNDDGYIALSEGQQANAFSDYHAREWAVLKNDKEILRIPFASVRVGAEVKQDGMPFTLTALKSCVQCLPILLSEVKDPSSLPRPDLRRRGMAEKVVLEDSPPAKEEERNQSGITFHLDGTNGTYDGLWFTWEGVPQPLTLKFGEDTYDIILRRVPTPLPFSIRLVNFVHETHPGTDTASRYASTVIVDDKGTTQQALIEMNQPLRYGSWVFYQSSFTEEDGKPVSVLAVVRNPGRELPYIATGLLALGLLVHLVQRLMRKRS